MLYQVNGVYHQTKYVTDPHPFNKKTFLLPVKGEIVDLLCISSKTLYRKLCSHKVTPPTAQARLNTEYPNLSFV